MKIGDLVRWWNPRPDVDDEPPLVGIILQVDEDNQGIFYVVGTADDQLICSSDDLEVISENR